MQAHAPRTDGGFCCKIARIADVYGIAGLDEELRRRRDEGASLRELAALIDDRIVAAALDDADAELAVDPTDVRHVVADDADAGDLETAVRERITTALDRGDVDTDALRRDFVSHETVRTHLADHLDVETSREPAGSTVESAREMIAAIRDRDASIVERALYALRRDDRVDSGAVDVSLTVRVTCSACGRSYTVDGFLDERGCECGGDGT